MVKSESYEIRSKEKETQIETDGRWFRNNPGYGLIGEPLDDDLVDDIWDGPPEEIPTSSHCRPLPPYGAEDWDQAGDLAAARRTFSEGEEDRDDCTVKRLSGVYTCAKTNRTVHIAG